MRYAKTGGNVGQINWEILPDNIHIEEDPDMQMLIPDEAQIVADIDLKSQPLIDTFFAHIFPDVTGHAKLMDEYLGDRRSCFHETYIHDNIKFHDSSPADNEGLDEDWKVKQGYMLIIAAACEIENGVDNLWKSGPSGGRHDFPDFGRYMSKNEFKCFASTAAFCWADKKHWFTDKRDMPWDVFLPCLSSFNERRKKLLKTVLLLLDESMSGWRPKTTRTGGLPNVTFEPRKPVPLGTMLKNGVECLTGCLVYQDVVQLKEQQQRKDFFNADSHLPDDSKISAHTAEVLRQVEGANVVPGGWVGGDSWFGSVATCVELRRRLDVHSTWIIKQNSHLFPMKALNAILKARFKDRPAGHWVVMRTEIGEVKMFAIAFAWSQKGISYFLSTCGKTSPSPKTYSTHFEDEFGFVQTRQINRPDIAHFLYDLLPLIDEHNKQRQSILNLEKCWPTRDCWFRLVVTLAGMCVVDFHRLYKNIMVSEGASSAAVTEVDDLQIRKFSDMLCKSLRPRNTRKPATLAQFSARYPHSQQEHPLLVRIQGSDGSVTRNPTIKQYNMCRAVGTSRQMKCYICRKYLSVQGMTVYVDTSFCCATCQMPLCKTDRRDTENGRVLTCLDEHLSSVDDGLGCGNTIHPRGKGFPKEKAVNLHPRRSRRRR